MEVLQKAALQPGDTQDFVKPLVPTLPLLLTQDVLLAPRLTTDFWDVLTEEELLKNI